MEILGAGDSRLYLGVLDQEESELLLQELISADIWASFHHRGGPVPRLVSVQADLTEDGDQPVYRHPTDSFVESIPICTAVETEYMLLYNFLISADLSYTLRFERFSLV
jgi:hypothetical protein